MLLVYINLSLFFVGGAKVIWLSIEKTPKLRRKCHSPFFMMNYTKSSKHYVTFVEQPLQFQMIYIIHPK